MKDDRGLYYYPFPTNKRVRMYVRRNMDEIEFRLWNQDDSQMWEAHGWVPHSAIVQAQAMYEGRGFNPQQAYDLDLAQAVLREA